MVGPSLNSVHLNDNHVNIHDDDDDDGDDDEEDDVMMMMMMMMMLWWWWWWCYDDDEDKDDIQIFAVPNMQRNAINVEPVLNFRLKGKRNNVARGGGRLLNIFWILFCFQASARSWRSWRDRSASRWLILPMSGLLRWVSIQQNIFSSCWWQCPSCFLLLMLFWRKTAAHFLQAAHCISNMQDELSTNVGDAFLRNVWWMMTHQKKR